LIRPVREDVTFTIADGVVTLVPGKTDLALALWGTYAAHVRNMIKGVTEGFTRILDIEGVGYRAEVKGTDLSLSMGYSHPVILAIPAGITAVVEKSAITLSSHDKDLLGQFAANVRKVRKPDTKVRVFAIVVSLLFVNKARKPSSSLWKHVINYKSAPVDTHAFVLGSVVHQIVHGWLSLKVTARFTRS
jgi:ribosomal protein L6P/L9E